MQYKIGDQVKVIDNRVEITLDEALNTIDTMALSYKKLEETGHIPKGAVTDNVNWGEIKELITKALGGN